MARILFLLLTLALLCAAQESESEGDWKFAVEQILASVRLGPLKDEFTPEYLGKRKYEGALQLQGMRLRARIASLMVEALGTQVNLCQPPEIDDVVVPPVLNEFRKHGFKDIQWIRGLQPCNMIQIQLPPPTYEKNELKE